MFLHVKQSDCKAAVKVVSGIWLKVCVPSFFLDVVELSSFPRKSFSQCRETEVLYAVIKETAIKNSDMVAD